MEETTQKAETLTQMITLRVTAREHYLIQRAAAAAGTSMNQWCKSLLLNEAEIVFLDEKHAISQGGAK